MSQAFTIELPEALQQTLIHQATQTHITPEQLRSLIGTLDLGTTDLGENHDQYIGEALDRELHNAE